MRIDEIAAHLSATVEGPADWEPTAAAALDEAGPTEIAFAKSAAQVLTTRAGCIVGPLDGPAIGSATLIRVAHPRAAFAQVLRLLYPPPAPPPGIDALAKVDPSAQLGARASASTPTP